MAAGGRNITNEELENISCFRIIDFQIWKNLEAIVEISKKVNDVDLNIHELYRESIKKYVKEYREKKRKFEVRQRNKVAY